MIVFLGMVFSMCGLMMRLKWCAWTAVFCSSISFANSRVSDDTKQVCIQMINSIYSYVPSLVIYKLVHVANKWPSHFLPHT